MVIDGKAIGLKMRWIFERKERRDLAKGAEQAGENLARAFTSDGGHLR
ncbi:hypothetical protein H0I39_11325 [Ottowia beijingensis]|uniref:Uncharacterized protein n=1 Tax=Ottowia beijingensis TaxID=1207057 RepID=A0A853IXC2_9BURK|nr:hypothetical protein [Ottowia beijingensis]NZA02190.1 hypothetical protein [Ottowia beijingensis]